jgi:hypothetical protein
MRFPPLLWTACDRARDNHDQGIEVDLAVDDQILRIIHAKRLRLIRCLPFQFTNDRLFQLFIQADTIAPSSSGRP